MFRNPVRPAIRALHAYTPGEQPRVAGLIKLNTNENPYPPSPRVLRAIRGAVDSRLRLYPDPTSDRLRRKIAQVYRFRIEQVIAGNGSDDILTLCLRAFVAEGQAVQFPWPTYSLYPVLTQIQGGAIRRVPFDPQYRLDERRMAAGAALTFVANPNAPSGTMIPIATLRRLARRLHGVLVVDEAYADFATGNALALARTLPNVIVTRSFSKSFSLAGIRLGFAVGHRDLIASMLKVKDSYNVDRLAQAAGEAALSDMAHLRRRVASVVRTRDRTRRTLEQHGWRVLPSEANFLLARPPRGDAEEWFALLRKERILVRWFSPRETREWLRISIGTDAEMRRLLEIVAR